MKQPSQARAARKHVILFLAANPHDTGRLALDREARSIHVELKRSGYRDRFDFVTRWAAEPLDLLRELRELKPTVVHFSGHGAHPIAATDLARGRDVVATAPSGGELGGVVFASANGRSQMVAPDAIAQTFGAVGAQVRLVVLNACYTAPIAEALLSHVDCVVGIGGAIHDDAARSFAIGFYGGLGEHESVATAFEQSKAAINLDGLFDAERPQLKVRDGFEAAQLILAAVPPSVLVDVPCPYPGMRPFAADDADSFHGRGSEIAELIGRLRAGEREIFVIGPSGSGKSSLVTAGVLPRLARGVAGLGQFVVRELRPGEQPAERLGQALELPAGEPLVVADRVAGLLAHRGPGASLLIVVDQLEELFTQSSAGERARFLDALGALRAERRCAVVFTLRADFFGAFMESALWAECRGQLSRVEVSPLRDEALREAIAAPAQAVGVAVESELIERLVVDAASEPGILPLLQETMVQLWDVRVDQTLTLADYWAMGDGERSGLAVALARRADTTLRRFTPAQAVIARRILLRLVAFGEGRSDTRRQQPRSKLCASAEETGVLQQMIDDRLLTAGEENGGEPRIDLAHEIMIAAWPSLAGWIQSHRVDEQRRRQLEAAAVQWVKHGRGARGLLDPIELAEAASWQQTESALQLGPSAEVSDLIAASRVAQVKQRRRRRGLLGSAFAALAAVAAVVAMLAITAQESANDARREADNAHQRLVQLHLGLGRQLLASDHPDRAVPYLLAARESGIEDVSLRALFRWATQYLPIQRLVHHGFVRHVAWSPDGRWLATGSDDRTVQVWDPGSGQPVISPLAHDSMITAIAWSPHGTWLATADDHSVRVWDVRTWTPATAPLVYEGQWDIRLLWSSDGSHLAIASGKTVRIWDAASGREATPPLTHQGRILIVAWSPEGQRMATASVDMTARVPNKAGIWPESGTTVRIWDAALGREATPPLTHQGSIIHAVAWSPDGQRVATASDDHTARVWDARSGQAVTPPLAHGMPVFALTWSPDGRRLATVSYRTARVWDANSGQPLGLPIAHASEVSMIAWSPDGRHVASFGHGTAWVWDPDSAIRPQVLFTVGSVIHNGRQEADADSRQAIPPLPVRSVNRIAWSPDGKWLATASSDGTAQVWDAGSQQAVMPPLPNRGDILALAWSPDSRRLAMGSWDQRARIWDVARGQSMPSLSHDGVVSAVAWSFDGRRLATASWDKTARVWDANSGQPVTPPLLHQGAVDTVAWSPDGKRLATASWDKTAWVWDANSGQPMTPSLVHPGRVMRLAWSPLGRQLATASEDQTTHVWNTDTGQEATPLLPNQGFITALVWNSSGLRVATRAIDGTVRLWDADSGQAITPPLLLQDQSGSAAIAWSPDGRRVAIVSADARARIWDAVSGQPLTPPLAHGSDVIAVAWSPDSKRVATGIVNGTALIWDVASGEAVTPPLTHRGRVSRLAWSPDGALLATASDDGTARVWDAASGQPVTPPLVHRVFLTAVAWSPDGRRLATASADNTARVWDVWDAGTLADWRAAAERCDYRMNSAGVLVEWDPVPDEHSDARLPSASPNSFAGQGSSSSSVPAAESEFPEFSRPHRSHTVDETQMKRDRSTVDETQSKLSEIQIKFDRYVSEAYPAWAREHRGRECPDTIDELNKYIGASDSLDPWGHPIKLLCGPTMPPGLSGFMLVSAGADGKFGTNDDLAPF